MSAKQPINFSFSPGIQCLLPLFYAAWADRVLSPTEIVALKGQAQKLSFLKELDLAILSEWSNPTKPPSRDLFKFWEIQMHDVSRDLPSEGQTTLVDIGLKLAQKAEDLLNGTQPGTDWKDPSIRNQLESIEDQLGQVRIETYRQIFPDYDAQRQEIGERLQAGFDISAMQDLLDDSYGDLRQRMRLLLSDPVFHYKNLRIKEDYREQVLEWCKLLAQQGLGALSYPKAQGGAGDMGQYAAVFEMLGYHDLSLAIKFGVQFGLFGGSILALGTEQHHKKYLEAIGKLELPGCFAMTETGHGSNVRGLETSATYDPEKQEFIVHSPNIEAGKEYIGNALHGQMATVFAQLIVGGQNQGVHAILVPLRNTNGQLLPGIRIEDCGYKLGLNGVDNGRIWFDQVHVPRENLLNRFGDVSSDGKYSSPIENPSRRFFTMLGTLVGGRVCVPRAGLSAAKSGLTIAIRYALRRRQFGPSYNEPETLLLDYPSHQRRLMPLLAKTYALDFALSYLTDRYLKRSEEDIREIESLAAGLKSYSTWFTTQTLQECREACGGKGYLAENRLADLKADTEIFTTFEGDNTVLMQLVAKGVLSEFRKEFQDEGLTAVLRHLGAQLGTAIAERNPIIIRRTDRDHLFDPEFQLNAFCYRERQLTVSLAQRIRGWIKKGKSAFDAFLKCQSHALALAEAYVESIVLEQFQVVIQKTTDNQLRQTLQNLCNLYALHTIEQHRGWYLEQDYISSAKSKAIRRLVDELCVKVRQDASALIEAFAIPEACLAAPIAQRAKTRSA